MYKTIATALLLTVAGLKATEGVQHDGAKLGEWTMDYSAALKLAKSAQKPLLLNFTGSDWCGWCKIMDKNVFAKADWKNFAADNVVLVTLDFPRDKSIVPGRYVERNKKLKDQFAVRGYPTYVIIDSDGKTTLGKLGAGRSKTPKSFITEFQNTVKLSANAIAAYVKAHPEKGDAYKAAIKEFSDSKKSLADWIATRPKRNPENNKKYEAFKDRISKAQAALGKF